MANIRADGWGMPWVLAACLGAAGLSGACQHTTPADSGPVIAGRVVDPLELRPEDAILMLGGEGGQSFSSIPVRLQADGSFVTPPLQPGTYVLEVVRTPHSPTKAATVVGFSIVPVTTSDVRGVTVTVRRDTAVQGRFRMESDNAAAQWPPHIHIGAYLAFEGSPLLAATGAEGAPGGRFVLRNAFGPRVLRAGYTLAPGSSWWPDRILLDGVDITNVPTDLSAHEHSLLEVTFTQHPAGFAGTVWDREGVPAEGAWVLVFAADPDRWHPWATTSHAVRAGANGGFGLTSLPATYLVRALPAAAFPSQRAALEQLAQVAPGAMLVELGDREMKKLMLTMEEP